MTTKLRITPSAFEAACAALKEKNPDLGMWFAGLASVHPSIVNLSIDSTHPRAEQTASVLATAKIGGRTGQSVARIVSALRGGSTDETQGEGSSESTATAAMVVENKAEKPPEGPEPEREREPEPVVVRTGGGSGEAVAAFSSQDQIDEALQPFVPLRTQFAEFLAKLDDEDKK